MHCLSLTDKCGMDSMFCLPPPSSFLAPSHMHALPSLPQSGGDEGLALGRKGEDKGWTLLIQSFVFAPGGSALIILGNSLRYF